MKNIEWGSGSGEWEIENEEWGKENGRWEMGKLKWKMRMENGK